MPFLKTAERKVAASDAMSEGDEGTANAETEAALETLVKREGVTARERDVASEMPPHGAGKPKEAEEAPGRAPEEKADSNELEFIETITR